ncbi:MAG: DinB family protein [Actinomycetota bacterium]|nr:DinB family protein [Actinomycetota bacterium]
MNASSPGGGSSIAQILAHLRAWGEVWGQAITRIINEESPAFKTANPRSWAERNSWMSQEFEVSYHALAKERAALQAGSPAPADLAWARHAVVTGAGAPLEVTAGAYASRLARHERGHLGQIRRTAAALMG